MTTAGRQATGYAFASPHEAIEAMLARLTGASIGTETVELAAACGRVLAEDITADRDSPAADVSSMDGFAVRTAELSRGPLVVDGELRIGRAPPPLRAGAVLRIVTGGAIPPGADSVLRVEDAVEADGRVSLRPGELLPKPGQFIRRRGENARVGAVVVPCGRIITPGTFSAMAVLGRAHVTVARRVRIAILSTGDEIVPHDSAPEPWQVRDGNGPGVRALLAARSWIDTVALELIPDEEDRLTEAIGAAVTNADAVVISGGVSMGGRDFVPAVVRALGGEVVFHKLPQRPGKPMLGAVMGGRVPLLGLPGNPVSALVTARRIVLPILARMAGADDPAAAAPRVTVADQDSATLDLWWHRLVTIGADGAAVFVPGMGSGDIVSAARADGFVEVPPGGTGAGPWPYFAWGS